MCTGCAGIPHGRATDAVNEVALEIPSRGTHIPATITLPAARTGPLPLVVLAHGHGGSRSEAGGFDRLALGLAQNGIASVRVDFPGCGDSREPFTLNNLSNMLLDVASARDYAINNYPIDVNRIAVHGYSMGARIALLSSRGHHWKAIGTWAPVSADGEASMLTFLGGRESWQVLREQADAHGHAVFETPFGQTQHLGRRWFSDLGSSRPLHAASAYRGPVLAICGRQDTIAPVRACDAMSHQLQFADVEQHSINGGHGFGFYSGEPETAEEVLRLTVAFYRRHMH